MSNGCICCTIREDLREALQLLAAKRRKGQVDFDRIVIETTGLADPGPVAQTFFMDDEIAETYLIDSIITWWTPSTPTSNSTTARKRAVRWALPTRCSCPRPTW
jgi:G3E family GTPase